MAELIIAIKLYCFGVLLAFIMTKVLLKPRNYENGQKLWKYCFASWVSVLVIMDLMMGDED